MQTHRGFCFGAESTDDDHLARPAQRASEAGPPTTLHDTQPPIDIAHWPWVRTHWWSGVEIDDLINLKAWVERLARRPACLRGLKNPAAKIDSAEDQAAFIQKAKAMLVK